MAAFALALVLWPSPPHRTLFVGGPVLAMDADDTVADAALVVGDAHRPRRRRVRRSPGWLDGTETVVALAGRTLLSGFVDAHGHFPAARLGGLGVDLSPPAGRRRRRPAGAAGAARPRPRPPTDPPSAGCSASTTTTRTSSKGATPRATSSMRPCPTARSGCATGAATWGSATRARSRRSSWTRATWRRPAARCGATRDGRLDGLVQERAAPALSALLREVPPRAGSLRALADARDDYLGAGVTTVQNGHASPATSALLAWGARLGPAAAARSCCGRPRPATASPHRRGRAARAWLGDERLRVGAREADSRRQSAGTDRVAQRAVPRGRDRRSPGSRPTYRGFPTIEIGRVRGRGDWRCTRRGAIWRSTRTGTRRSTRRWTRSRRRSRRRSARRRGAGAMGPTRPATSSCTPRPRVPTSFERMAALGVSATFFPAHVPHWGDWHLTRALGPERAARISPLASADAAEVRWSAHSRRARDPDAGARDRRRGGRAAHALGRRCSAPEERVSTARGRCARSRSTRRGRTAWKHDRGSIEVGKLADLVVLSGDPLTAPRAAELEVDAVWIGGRREFVRPDATVAP